MRPADVARELQGLFVARAGHRAGAENLKELCRNCGNYGVKYLTVYAFSTENWIRPEDEVNALMKLFVEFFNKYYCSIQTVYDIERSSSTSTRYQDEIHNIKRY